MADERDIVERLCDARSRYQVSPPPAPYGIKATAYVLGDTPHDRMLTEAATTITKLREEVAEWRAANETIHWYCEMHEDGYNALKARVIEVTGPFAEYSDNLDQYNRARYVPRDAFRALAQLYHDVGGKDATG